MTERQTSFGVRPNLAPQFFYGEQSGSMTELKKSVGESIDDIIKVGKNGDTYHRPDGKFLSAHEVATINAHAGQIREGVNPTPESNNVSSNNRQTSEPGSLRINSTDINIDHPKDLNIAGDAQPSGERATIDTSSVVAAEEGESQEEYQLRNGVDPSLRIEEGDMPILRPREIETDASESSEIDDNAAAESSEASSNEAVAEADKRLRTWFNRAKEALYTGAARGYVTARGKIDKLKQSTGQKEYETPEDYEARMKLSGRLYALGIVVVAAAILADKFAVGSGADVLGISGSGSGGGSAHLETAQLNHIGTTSAHGSWGGSESFSTNAFTVDPGEGWNQTFKDMNIPQSEWSDVLQKAGPQLKENGWAYQMPNGQWGISKPGQLPQSVLQLIDNSRTK